MDGKAEQGVPGGGLKRSGILLVDKPSGMTSHDVVARTRRLAGTRKVGHAGTLDPMATGLLILGLNSSTRLLTFIVGLDKQYRATIQLGQTTTTDDAEGEVTSVAASGTVGKLSSTSIADQVRELTGEISQVPSTVSAIKVDGKRAYARVRAGETVVLKARTVTVSRFEVLSSTRGTTTEGQDVLDLDVIVDCSTGTYIRALARDLGASLGVGGHLTALRRTRIGGFHVEHAHAIDSPDVAANLLAPAAVASSMFESIVLTESEGIDLGHGKRIERPDQVGVTGPIAALSGSGSLVGLVEMRGSQVRSIVNFPEDEVS